MSLNETHSKITELLLRIFEQNGHIPSNEIFMVREHPFNLKVGEGGGGYGFL